MKNASEHYAFVSFGDVSGPNGTISADRIFEGLFKLRRWYATRSGVSVGTRLLFYQGGVGFKGCAVVDTVTEVATSQLFGTPIFLKFSRCLSLSACRAFDKPLAVGDLVNKLDFIKNKTYWGHSFRSTPRKISKKDYITIMDRAKKSDVL